MKKILSHSIPLLLTVILLLLTQGTVPVHANGGPAVSLDTNSIDFGNVLVGDVSAIETVTVTNTGVTNLNITNLDITGDFWIMTYGCTDGSIAPGSSCTIDVAFFPSSVGPKTGVLTITSDAPSTPDTVDLSGNGIAGEIQVVPSPLNFGNQLVGTPASQTVTVNNIGLADLHIGALSITGTGFTLSDNLCDNTTILPTGSCTFNVTFNPSNVGGKTGEVSIPSDSGGITSELAESNGYYYPVITPLSLLGNGILAGEIQVTPSPLNFGSQLVGTSATRTVTVKNIGLSDLHIGTLSITGTGFTLGNNLCDNTTILPAGSCTFHVTFNPSSVGAKTGQVSIPSDSGGIPPSSDKNNIYYYPVITPLPLLGNGILGQTNLIFKSSGGYDGTVRESSKDSRVGGFNEPISALISVGDDYLNRQYVGILHFNTAGIPDNAVITSARIQVKGMILSNTTYVRLGELTADVMNPHFGTFTGLENVDFQAPALVRNIGTFTRAPTYYQWVTLNMKPASLFAVNKTGTTQFRLHFAKKYYNDNIKQMFRFLSGDFWIPADFPKLIVTYYIP